MEAIGEKWKRMAKELFDLFSKTMTEHGYVVKEVIHPIFHPKNIQDMFKMGVTRPDIEDMIVFAVANWDRFKGLHNMKGLAHEPTFNQMMSNFKYPTLIYISKTGFEAVEKQYEAPKKEVVKEPDPLDGLSEEERRELEKWFKTKITI